jgi:ssDNA-binding Zn-finger/Zn-ribbon topoisomerase 1
MSNNTIRYTIYKGDDEVGYHTQNVLCKRCNDNLMEYQPASDYTIVCDGYEDYYDGYYDDDDYEYEEQSEPERVNLQEWLIKNPGEFTHKKFSPGDTIKLNKKRGLTEVIEARKGKWMPEYLVILDGVETIIGQWDIIPL